MRILLIEDDRQIASFVEKGLREAGFAVDAAVDGTQGLHLARTAPYDAMIIDVMLPGIDGFSLIETIRSEGNRTPLLILSARRSVEDKVAGLRKGGDDYLTKPFSFDELLARLHALIRRSAGSSGTGELRVEDLVLDPVSRRVSRDGEMVELQPREFALLEYLMRNAGNVVSKTMILERVWDYRFDPQTNVVDVLVHRLRAKIDRERERKLIHTVRGAGYVLKAEG